MADQLVVDLDTDGSVSVSLWRNGQLVVAPTAELREVAWPLSDDALERLRWYLEDYLRAPYGVYGDEGAAVAGALTGWGQAVFGAVFGSGPGHGAYLRARARTGTGTEIVIRSSSAALLGLPWELMCDPSRPTPLALDLAGLTRRVSTPVGDLDEAVAAGGDRLRVLMVISRPYGPRDVGYRMIARPLLERLKLARGRVELVVLRPPTLEALNKALVGALAEDRSFHVVHFDGHGVLTDAEGALVFEKSNGRPDRVGAGSLAQVLRAGRVPLVVLNACQSGAVGKQLEAAIATRLLQEGTASVVAMAYRVHTVAAAEFMVAFYDRLFACDPIAGAVSAGRRRLHERNERPSPKGMMPLADWVIPVHYQHREVEFPDLHDGGPRGRSLEVDAQSREDRSLAPVGSFVGRDDLFYEMERAARLHRVVVLHGLGGTGKTELAKAFGRWWLDTGAVEPADGVMVHSFEPGAASFGLDGVVSEIGVRVLGADFARLDAAERRAHVEDVLRRRRVLLIWDSFESVQSMPDSARSAPPLGHAGRQELRAFLHRLAAGPSSAIVASRNAESWLGDVGRLEVGGLAPDEATEYAEQLLGSIPAAAPRRAKRAFAELLGWLDGHPLSMRLVLPHLAVTEPEVLLAGLRGIGERPSSVRDGGGRLTSLETCITYSFDHVAARTRRLLVAVCLFHSVVDVRSIAMLSGLPGVPERFAGFTKQDWVEALDDAASVGLLARIDANAYRIHPALPGYLAARWRSAEPGEYDQQRVAVTRALVTAHAWMGDWLIREISSGGDAPVAFAVIDQQRATLAQFLGFALESEMWNEAVSIAQPLFDYFSHRGLPEEAEGWVDRARLALEADGAPPALDSAAGALWLFLMRGRAHRQTLGGHLASAKATYLDTVGMLEAMPRSDQQRRELAETYNGLSNVAVLMGRLDEAQRWSAMGVTSWEELGYAQATGRSYLTRGIAAQEKGDVDEAENWYRRSLAIAEKLGDAQAIATVCHQLSRVAVERQRLDDARDWSRRSLTVSGRVGDQLAVARSYHQLALIAHLRGQLEEAGDWHLKSLGLREELGDRPAMARTYHELGMVAQDQGRLDDAGAWYAKSLTIKEELGDRRAMALTYGQLGLLAEQRGDDPAAMEWTVRCVALFDEFPHPATAAGPYELTRLTARLGMAALEACWQWVTGEWLPEAVRNFIDASTPGAGERFEGSGDE